MSGQLGDMSPPAMASPQKQPAPSPAPSSTLAPAAVDSKPVVEAADLTPPSPETKVVPAPVPIPDSEVISSDHDAAHSVSVPPPNNTPHETPQSTDHKQPLADEPVSEPVIHAEQEAPISESVAESIPAAPAVEQQQDSSEKIAEDHPHTETDSSDTDRQTQSVSVSKIPAVQQLQSSSEKVTEEFPPPAEREMQNLLTTGLDRTTVPAEVEKEPNPRITQSEAPAILTDNEKVELTSEQLPEVTTNLVEPKPALTSEVITQEISVQPHPMPDPTATHAKEGKIIEVELGKPIEETQVDQEAQEAGQTPSDSVDTAYNGEQTNAIPKLNDDSVTPGIDIDVTELIKTESEAIIEKPAMAEDTPHPPVEIVENMSPVVPVHTEPTPLDTANMSPLVAPVEVETKDHKKVNKENPTENTVFEKVLIEGEMAKQNVEETIKDTTGEKNDKEIVVEKETTEEIAGSEKKSSNGKAFEEEGIQNSAAADRVIEVKADGRKAFEEEETAQKTVEKANDQKPLEEEGNKAESRPAPSSTETGNVFPVIERKESETAGESAPTSTEEIPKEETQICKEMGANEPSRSEESFDETVLLLKKLEEKGKPMVEAENVAQKEEEQTPIDTVLKADDKSEQAVVMSAPPAPDCEEQEKVNAKEPVQSVEMVSSSAVLNETQVRDKVCEEKVFQDETQVGSHNTNSVAEDQHGVEREMLGLTDSDEKQVEKVAELPVNAEKLDKKEDKSQPVAGKIQETISVSETSTVCNKDGTAHFHVEESLVSKTDEVSDTAFEIGGASPTVASVPVAEPEIPVLIVSKQDKKPTEKNTNIGEEEESKAHRLGEPSEDAVTEVTIVLSPSSVRLYGYFCKKKNSLFPPCLQ